MNNLRLLHLLSPANLQVLVLELVNSPKLNLLGLKKPRKVKRYSKNSTE
jgi:hypothetical protein